jgi:hypothetical protein
MQISLQEEEHRRVKARAAERGVSVAEYVRQLLAAEAEPPKARAGIEAIFGLGASARSDISSRLDEFAAEAAAWEHERRTLAEPPE